MARTLLIVERNQDRFGNLSFIVQGKFDELTPMGLTERDVVVEHNGTSLPATITEATVRAGVLTLRLSGADIAKVMRGAKIQVA